MAMEVNFFNDKNSSEYVKEFYLIPTLCLVKLKMNIGYSLRWGFWGLLIIWKEENK
jgi:hypothetical protein